MTSSCTSSASSNFFPAGCFFLRHILLIHNVTINSNNLFVNFRWTSAFCVEKSYDGTHLTFGGTLDRRCHFKHVSLKQSRFYRCQTSMAHRYRIKVDGSVAIISIKNFPIGLHVMYLYFQDTPRTRLFFSSGIFTLGKGIGSSSSTTVSTSQITHNHIPEDYCLQGNIILKFISNKFKSHKSYH